MALTNILRTGAFTAALMLGSASAAEHEIIGHDNKIHVIDTEESERQDKEDLCEKVEKEEYDYTPMYKVRFEGLMYDGMLEGDRDDLDSRISKYNIRFSRLFEETKERFIKDFGMHAEIFRDMVFFASPTSKAFISEVEHQQLLDKYTKAYKELIKEFPEEETVQFWYAVSLDLKAKKINNSMPSTKYYVKSIKSMIDSLDQSEGIEYNDKVSDIIFAINAFLASPPPTNVNKKKITTPIIRGDPYSKSIEVLDYLFRNVPVQADQVKMTETARSYFFAKYAESIDIQRRSRNKKKVEDKVLKLNIETWYLERFLYSGVNFDNLVSFEHKGKTYMRYLDESPELIKNDVRIPQDKEILDYGMLDEKKDGKTHFIRLKNKTIYLSEDEYDSKVKVTDAVELQLRAFCTSPYFYPQKQNFSKKRIEKLVKKYSGYVRDNDWSWAKEGINQESAKAANGPKVHSVLLGIDP